MRDVYKELKELDYFAYDEIAKEVIMPIMSKQLEDDFKICIDRVIESRYEDDKINCCIMDLKSKVLREMATLSNNKYTAPQATPKFCPRCPYQMIPSGDGYVCTKCGYCE